VKYGENFLCNTGLCKCIFESEIMNLKLNQRKVIMNVKLIYLIVFLLIFSAMKTFSQTTSIEPGSEKDRNLLYTTSNPFNETTTIKFFLKQDCYVKLSALNRENGSIIELVDGNLAAGEHGIIFKAPMNINTAYKCVLTAYSEAVDSVLYSTEIEMEHKAKP